ncbi:hypothetical protein SLEP1_g41114 [Rubroshorea leprosula]|uniref:CCHC-type domain-containing protein n=1 Tax=Rubroshorea leprosula TaxID=152421 RepID=A0AAV5L6F5_9ROSI|nr:hypothetical protein SLEP1_g41114 [Rubroshorea leprosula]
MASETFAQPAIPRFDGHYDHWSMLMENFLRSKEYWDVVESRIAEPTARMSKAQKAELEALKLKDLKAKIYLFQAIDRTILETILCKDTSKQIWDSMKKKYQGTTKTKRQQLQALRSEFEILRMKEGETVTDYFSRTMAIVNKLRTHGDKTQDVTVVEKILRSMTPKYNFVVYAIEEANDLDEMSLKELESSLLVHERKLNRQEQNEQALKATIGTSSSFSNRSNRGRGRGRGRNQQTQFFEGRGRGRGRFKISYRPKSADKSKVECFRCHKYGHYQSECRANLPNNEGEKSNFAQIEEEISLLMVCHDGERSNKNLWYLDTGCSNHMCGDKAAFSILDESFRDNVKFGDNSKVSVRGRGQVTIQIRGNAAQTISNVLYVQELKTNLLSIGQLQEKGYEIIIKNRVCQIQDSKLGLIAQVKMTTNRMFPLHLNCASQSCFSAKTNDVAWLWHSRYGHLNFGGLKQLQQKNMVTGLPVFESPSTVCEECVVSKQHRVPFPKGRSTRARRLLEIVYSDICGPINPVSNGEVDQSAAGIFISQKKYVQDILDRFRIKDSNPVSTPIDAGMKLVKNPKGKKVNSTLYKQIVGSLMYLNATRPDIMHAVSLISRYMESPKEMHLLAAKRILRYLKGTVEYGLFYKKREKSDMFGFTDSDFARDVDDRKSTSGYVFMMGTTAVSWSSRKQPIVTLSTTEAEFVAATSCACQAIWLLRILEECHFKQEEPLIIFCDNNSTIKLSKNLILHGRCKHIDVRNYFLRDLVKEGVIDLVYCRSEDQLADIFTKPLKLSAFQKQRKLLGVCVLENLLN